MPSRQQVQGGKVFGLLKAQQEERLNCINKEFLEDEKYNDVEELGEKLESFKKKYVEFDLNDQGDIDLMSLKQMLEKLGVPKTHLEVKKMITEVTGGGRETISYRDFVTMMLGKRSGVLKLSRSCTAPSALGCDSERLTMAEPEAEPRGQGGGDRERGRSRRKVSRRHLKIGKERNYIV